MTSTTTSTLSLVNTESGRGPPIEVEVCPVNTMSPSACTINIKNGPSGKGSARTATPNEHAAPQVQADSDDASHISINSSYLDSTHLSTDSSTSNYRPGLDSRRSSSSLASSINTVIHLGSSTAVDPTPTSQIAHGSILGSRSDSSHLLSDLVAKSAPNADPPDSTDSHGSKIQFHNVVRISGGISSSPKRKKASKQIPRNITIDSQRPLSIAPPRANTSRSPLGRSSFGNSPPNCYPHPISSLNRPSPPDSRFARGGEIMRFDTSDSSSSSVGRSFHIHKQSTLRPGPPSARSSFSHRSRADSTSPSGTSYQYGTPGSHHPTSTFKYTRTASISSSVTGSGNYSATIISRSSSPASSLYLPLKVPVARAPAPFFGPTPERVARVRERRQVAQRDAERAKGGWKAWWNNWYYQSDRFATRKGKGKQDSTSTSEHANRTDYHSVSVGDLDSDDGSCYHDVILEHERKKLERKLNKLRRLKQIRASVDRSTARPASSTHDHGGKKKRTHPEKADAKAPQSWLSWVSSIIVGMPPPVHPLLLPTPASGILRRPALATTPLLPGKPVLPLISEPSSDPPPICYVTAPDADSRTPLLSQPFNVPSYSPQDISAEASSPGITSFTDARFGVAPRRWFSLAWWIWKIQTLCLACYLDIKSKLVGLFRVDWDRDDRRYEGWGNV